MSSSASSASPPSTPPPTAPARARIFDGPVLVGLAIYGACLALVLVLYHFQ
ncbi:MAG: hypothetical protein U0610_05285 [bacterium]